MKLTRMPVPEMSFTIALTFMGLLLTGVLQATPPAPDATDTGTGIALLLGQGDLAQVNTGHSAVLPAQRDTLADSLQVEVQLHDEIQRIQQAVQQAQQEIMQAQHDSLVRKQVDMEELNRNLRDAMQELEQLRQSGELQRLENMNIEVNIPEISRRPFLGLVVDDLNFRKAYEMHYDENYGVLVTSVIPNSSADAAGIAQGDIIMDFDGQKVWYARMLKNYLDTKKVGDQVNLTIFRNGEEMDITMKLQPRMITLPWPHAEAPEDTVGEGAMAEKAPEPEWNNEKWGDVNWDSEDFLPSKGFFANGYGGGGWIPVWFQMDMTNMNQLVTSLGFEALPRNGILLQGGGGKGPIGNGWFIGGMGAGYGLDRTIRLQNQGMGGLTNVRRHIHYGTSFGGVTLDKRLRLTKNLVTGAGFLLGGGGTSLEISQSDGAYDWTSLNESFNQGDNSYLKIKKSYLIFQPKVMFMVRLTPWLAIRSEAGYMLGYSFKKGWEAQVAKEKFEMMDAPANNNLTGFTFSIGPWFGF